MRQISFILLLVGWVGVVVAQPTESAARLIVNAPTVEVQRMGTDDWIAVQETVLGSGDRVRTGFVGRARVVFNGGTEAILQPNSSVRIEQFSQDEEAQQVDVTFLSGNILFRFAQTQGSEYLLRTPRGDIRTTGANIAASQREDAQLAFVVQAGEAEIAYNDTMTPVEAGEGWRFESDGELSAVVGAAAFEEVDSLLDGCPAELRPDDNRRLPVYLTPDAEGAGVGVQSPLDVTRILGTTDDESWYRIRYRGGAGWIQADLLRRVIVTECPALRVFPADHTENAEEYIDTNRPAFQYCTGGLPIPEGWVDHTLQPGQTLFLLADRTGTTVDALALVNCIADVRRLPAGGAIALPAAP